MKTEVLQGEAILVLEKIPSDSIDCLITDPPYSIGVTSHGNVQSWLDNITLHPFWTAYFTQVQRVLKDGAAVYINCDWRTYPFIYPYAARFLNVRNCIVWDYEWIKAGSHYRFSHEFVIYATKGDSARTFDAGKENRDVWRIAPMNFTRKDKRHQAEKPEELIEKMILNSTVEGDVILDTFSGSGTTGAVAQRLKRSFVGIELNPEYVAMTEERIAGGNLTL